MNIHFKSNFSRLTGDIRKWVGNESWPNSDYNKNEYCPFACMSVYGLIMQNL